jgi:hypothetical protein
MSCKTLSLLAACGLLAGCETVYPASQSTDPGFGEAVKYNAAVQTIDPDPVYDADDAQPGYHGEKGAEAVKRYRTDAVKDVERQTTSGEGGGGSPQ